METGPAGAGGDLRRSGDRIEELLAELHAGAPERCLEQIGELLGLVSDLYGAGLARLAEAVERADPELWASLVADDLLASLLLVHGLHPESLPRRVGAALDEVRPLLRSHAGDVELLDVDEAAGAVRLRLLGSCDGCPSSAITLQSAVERAILAAAPEVVRIDVDGPSAPPGVAVAIGAKPAHEQCPSGVGAA